MSKIVSQTELFNLVMLRRKLNSNQQYYTQKLTLCQILLMAKGIYPKIMSNYNSDFVVSFERFTLSKINWLEKE